LGEVTFVNTFALTPANLVPILPFDGSKLAERGVVVVTFNYRLGMLGFLAHPELSAESKHHSSGNYGLMDQVAALHWMEENIAKFGGDPAQVTIFGQSAGAHDIGMLLTSPLAKGLFVRAVAESGTVMIGGHLTPPLAKLETAGRELAKRMGAPQTGAVAYMRKLSPAEVLKAAPPLHWRRRTAAGAEHRWVRGAETARRGLSHGAGDRCAADHRKQCP
jgi:para-nitrobenzyl esterase